LVDKIAVKVSPKGKFMADRIMIRLNEITESATVDQIKYWCKLLDIQPEIISRAAHVTAEECEILRKMAGLTDEGMRPGEAAAMLTNTAVTVSPVKQKESEPELLQRIETLERAILLLVEQNKKLATTIEKQNEVQTKKLEAIQYRLEPAKQDFHKLEPWQPKPKKKPQFPALKRLWYELIDPVKLRAI